MLNVYKREDDSGIRRILDGNISYFHKLYSSWGEVTGVNEDVQVLLQQREDAVSHPAAGLQQHQPLGLKLHITRSTNTLLLYLSTFFWYQYFTPLHYYLESLRAY